MFIPDSRVGVIGTSGLALMIISYLRNFRSVESAAGSEHEDVRATTTTRQSLTGVAGSRERKFQDRGISVKLICD